MQSYCIIKPAELNKTAAANKTQKKKKKSCFIELNLGWTIILKLSSFFDLINLCFNKVPYSVFCSSIVVLLVNLLKAHWVNLGI